MSESSTSAATDVEVATPEIRWHCGPTGLNEAVLSLDFLHEAAFSPGSAASILATGGADKEIKLWRVLPQVKDNDSLEFIFSLTGHDRSVNCVRFSPNGQHLASASDDSTIIVWTKPKTAGDDWSWDKITSFSDVSRILLACGHKGDITDLSWSPDSLYLCSGSVDNCCVVWNAEKGEVVERRKDHMQYVQGVAWDPLGEFLVTEGNDRTCRVYSLVGFDPISSQNPSKKHVRKCANMITLKTREFPRAREEDTVTKSVSESKISEVDDVGMKGPPKHCMFLADTCPVFARRLSWTPCGNYLLAPTGVFRESEGATAVNAVYGFARGNMTRPALHLPGHEKASLGVRCSPLLYKLKSTDESKANFFKMPHRSVFAVITLNAVIIYDSQLHHPLCTIKNLHYADLTDASWSADGQTLSISSMDGYISFIRFSTDFFGASISREDVRKANHEKEIRMFTSSKTTRKKVKASPVTVQSGEDAGIAAKSPVITKKEAGLTSPLLQAFKKREASRSGDAATPIDVSAEPAPVVNTLHVRKKRKIQPKLVGQPLVSNSEEPSVALTPGTIVLTEDSVDEASGKAATE